MQKHHFIALVFGIFLLPETSSAQPDQVCQQDFKIVKTADKYHFNPRPLNDAFSQRVFDAFIKMLDVDDYYLQKKSLER